MISPWRLLLRCELVVLSGVVLAAGFVALLAWGGGVAGAAGSVACTASFVPGTLPAGGYTLSCTGVAGPGLDVTVLDDGVPFELSVTSIAGCGESLPPYGSLPGSFTGSTDGHGGPADGCGFAEESGGVVVANAGVESGVCPDSGAPCPGTVGLWDSNFDPSPNYGLPGGDGVVTVVSQGGGFSASSALTGLGSGFGGLVGPAVVVAAIAMAGVAVVLWAIMWILGFLARRDRA